MPEAYANLKQLPLPDAKQQLLEQMHMVHGTIDFYSFDFWSEQTGLDITDLHQQESQRIAFRADAGGFKLVGEAPTRLLPPTPTITRYA